YFNKEFKWNSRGNKENMQLSSSSSLNAKLYKAFCKNRFSVTLEANDIFNKSNRDIRFYNKDVTLWQSSTSDSRALLLTLQYNFNTSKNRYKGKGAGHEELNRF
ncbi:MAG: outer membrane beta-barrel protein, partial [Segatella copri]|nr:outer membrane beta-barrel protein [Segatella copri]